MKNTIIVCRTAREPLAAGAVRSGSCAWCGEPLQMSSAGRHRRDQFPTAPLLCNECAVALVKGMESSGKTVEVEIGPFAQEALDRGVDNRLAKLLRKSKGAGS